MHVLLMAHTHSSHLKVRFTFENTFEKEMGHHEITNNLCTSIINLVGLDAIQCMWCVMCQLHDCLQFGAKVQTFATYIRRELSKDLIRTHFETKMNWSLVLCLLSIVGVTVVMVIMKLLTMLETFFHTNICKYILI